MHFAQPHHMMNEMRSSLEDNWEYVGYDLLFREFKVHANVFLNNRQHGLKLFIEANASMPTNCA
jgi:nitrous oxidase accessory protein NosD